MVYTDYIPRRGSRCSVTELSRRTRRACAQRLMSAPHPGRCDHNRGCWTAVLLARRDLPGRQRARRGAGWHTGMCASVPPTASLSLSRVPSSRRDEHAPCRSRDATSESLPSNGQPRTRRRAAACAGPCHHGMCAALAPPGRASTVPYGAYGGISRRSPAPHLETPESL